MKRLRQANVLYLNNEAEADFFCDYADEEVQKRFRENRQRLEQQVKGHLGSPNNIVLPYTWYGSDSPFSCEHNIPFDPKLVNIIVPEDQTMFYIQSLDRRVVLTFPPLWNGEEPNYAIVSNDANCMANVRILPNKAFPFTGLESTFEEGGFEELPLLKDHPQYGAVIIREREIVLPKSVEVI